MSESTGFFRLRLVVMSFVPSDWSGRLRGFPNLEPPGNVRPSFTPPCHFCPPTNLQPHPSSTWLGSGLNRSFKTHTFLLKGLEPSSDPNKRHLRFCLSDFYTPNLVTSLTFVLLIYLQRGSTESLRSLQREGLSSNLLTKDLLD